MPVNYVTLEIDANTVSMRSGRSPQPRLELPREALDSPNATVTDAAKALRNGGIRQPRIREAFRSFLPIGAAANHLSQYREFRR